MTAQRQLLKKSLLVNFTFISDILHAFPRVSKMSSKENWEKMEGSIFELKKKKKRVMMQSLVQKFILYAFHSWKKRSFPR